MAKYVIVVEFFGKNYAGWQCQNNAVSVQGVLEEKLSLILQQKMKIYASGRTDKGVHSYGQVAHFTYNGTIPPMKIALAVNTVLPTDIRVVDAYEVAEDFHAQYSAKKKTYIYKFYVSRILSPIREDTYGQIPYSEDMLNYEKMQN
ncbi:MAG: tRNA pseudouridine(38-40) synthase TruA, partial [Clostridia bacterium]